MKKAFTLIELLVVVVIFMMIFLMTMSFVRLASGSVISARQKLLTNDIRNVYETISYSVNNASGRIAGTMGPIVVNNNPNILMVLRTRIVGGTIDCSQIFYFAKEGAIWTTERQTCLDSSWPGQNDPISRMTSSEIKVNDLKFNYSKDSAGIPYLQMIINAKDADLQYQNDNVIDFQTSYTVDYQSLIYKWD